MRLNFISARGARFLGEANLHNRSRLGFSRGKRNHVYSMQPRECYFSCTKKEKNKGEETKVIYRNLTRSVTRTLTAIILTIQVKTGAIQPTK